MINKFLIPTGYRDNLNFEAYVEHQYKNMIIEYFRSYGFNLVKTPLIEYSENLNKNTLKIQTKRKKERLSLRNDITPQIIRLASSRLVRKKRPLKLCYYGEVVREYGSMLRPEKQFQQVGAEIIGSNNIKADVEIITLAYEALRKIGIRNIVIEISSSLFLTNFFKKIKDKKIITTLKKFIRLKDLNNCLRVLKSNKEKKELKQIFKSSGYFKKVKIELKNLAKISDDKKEIKNLIKVIESIKLSKKDEISIDISECEINDYNYYNGIKFIFFAKNIRGEIARGGRYQLKYGNNSETAIGFSCYMDTVLRASTFENNDNQILIKFNIPEKEKNKLLNRGFRLFSVFDDNIELKKHAKKYKCLYYFDNGKVYKI